MRKILMATLAVAALAAAAQASAATATTTFQVTATVLKTCQVNVPAALGFGNYTPGTGAVTAVATVNVNCTKTTPFTVALNAGTTTGGTIAQRLMASGVNTLQYNLYTSNAYTTIFGDGTGGSSTQAGTGAGLATASSYTVYGQLLDSAANQAAVPGAYADTITVTVTY